MARFVLGSIVTDIQGSIGGTTFRRTPSGHIAYNKQKRQLKSATSINSRKIEIGQLFQKWSLLDKNVRDAWKAQALLFPFPDKFGKNKFLTGRQLFIKLNSQLTVVSGSISDPNSLDSAIEISDIQDLSASKNTNECVLVFKKSITANNVCVAFYPLRKGRGVKPHAHFKTAISLPLAHEDTLELGQWFFNTFPLAQIGQTYGVNVYSINESGFKSAVVSTTFVVM